MHLSLFFVLRLFQLFLCSVGPLEHLFHYFLELLSTLLILNFICQLDISEGSVVLSNLSHELEAYLLRFNLCLDDLQVITE